MTVQTPLYNDGGNLREMSTEQIDQIINQIVYRYSIDPSVVLDVVASGGNLDAINDTRLTAGAASSSGSDFPAEGTTAEPGTTTTTFDRLDQIYRSINGLPVADTTDQTADTTILTSDQANDSGKTFPIYYDNSDIRAMTLGDFYDTFIHPAIDQLIESTTTATNSQAGTYVIKGGTATAENNADADDITCDSISIRTDFFEEPITLENATLVEPTPVFIDTRANTELYSADGIPETLDQSKTIESYYLFRINGVNNSYTAPMFITDDNNLQVYDSDIFGDLLTNHIRYEASQSASGYKITYSLANDSTGFNRGEGMVDTILDGSGNYQTKLDGATYRAQEFPNGNISTANTYFLKINKT